MFIITKRFTRVKAVVSILLLGALLAGLILLTGSCRSRDTETEILSGESNEDRLAYLTELGWQVAAEPVETLHLQLPEDFGDADYAAYQQLQLSQGFDLAPYAGEQVVRYTYAVENYPGRSDAVQLNLYCCKGSVIAGDVIAPGENGFQGPLAFSSAA